MIRPTRTLFIRFKFLTVLFLVFSSVTGFSQNFELQLLQKINVERNKNTDGVMYAFSNSVFPITLATPFCVYLIGSAKNNFEIKQKGTNQLLGLALEASLTTSLKYIIQRPRPYVTYPQLTPYNIEGLYSLPSSHTSFSFYTATINTLQFKKWYIGLPFYAWASTCAYSRMHLGVHYPSDVVAGAVVGAGSAWLTYRANKWLHKKIARIYRAI